MKLCRSRLPIHVRSSFVPRPRTLRLLVQQRGDAFQNRSFLTGRGGGRSRGFSTAAEALVDLESCERRLAELLRRFDNAKSRAELKKAYFTRAKTCHPDTAEGTAGAGGSNKMENEGTSSSFVTLQSDYSEALKLMDVVQRLRNLRQPASGSVNNDSAQPGEGSFSDLLDEEERKQRQREACEAAIAAEDAEARAEMRKVLASSFGCFLVLYWMWRGLDDTRKDASESWYFESGHHQRVAATKLAAQQAGTGGNTSNSTTTLCEFLVYYLFGSDYYGKSSDPRQQLLEAQGGACGKGDAGSMSATFIRRQYQRWRLEMQRQKLRDELSSCSCQDDSEYESADVDVVVKANHDEEVAGSCASSSSRTSWSAASRRETLTSTLTSEVVSLRGGEFIQLLNNIGVTIDWTKVRTNKRAREQQEEKEKRAKLREGGEMDHSANRDYPPVDTEEKPLATLRDNNLYADNLLLDDLVQRARATREERELRMERSGPGKAG